MAKRDKRLDRIRRNPTNVSPDQLHAILVAAGFESVQRGTSHKHYYHASDSKLLLVIPQHKPLRRYYVKRALNAIDLVSEEGQNP